MISIRKLLSIITAKQRNLLDLAEESRRREEKLADFQAMRRLLEETRQPDLDELLSGHVVPRNPLLQAQILSDFHCICCRSLYQVWLWPHNEVVVECQCAAK